MAISTNDKIQIFIDEAEVEHNQNNKFEETKQDMAILMDKLGNDTRSYNSYDTIEFINEFNNQNKRFLYSQITTIIYRLEKDQDDIKLTNIQSNMDVLLKDLFRSNEDINAPINKMAVKLYDHINLAIRQYSNLVDTEEEFRTRIGPFMNKISHDMSIHVETATSKSLKNITETETKIISQLNSTSDKLKTEFDNNIKITVDKLKSDFNKDIKITIAESKQSISSDMFTNMIAVLGIFTAISFMVFGTWNLIDTTLTGFDDVCDTMIIWSLLVLGVATIILTLLWGISKLTQRPLFDKSNSKKFIVFCYSICLLILAIGIYLKFIEVNV